MTEFSKELFGTCSFRILRIFNCEGRSFAIKVVNNTLIQRTNYGFFASSWVNKATTKNMNKEKFFVFLQLFAVDRQ